MEKNEEQTIDEAWRKQMGALCAGFQKSQGEMIIVASQPSRPLFACCTTKVKKQMLRHFSTFKECLKISNNLGSPSVNPCCLCFNVPEKDDVRDCEVEDVWSALGIKVPRGGKVCVDCSDNLHKFLYFKKKITAIHVKKKLATKRKTGTATQENVKNKVFNGVKASEAVTGQAEKDSGESHEHLSEIETFSDIEMADITEESDQKANIDKGQHQEQNSLSADTEVQSDAESFLSEIKEEGTFEDESLISSSQDQSKLSLGVNTGGLGGVDTQTTPILRSALCSTLPPNKMTTPPTPNIKTEVSLSSTPQTASSMFSMVFFGDPKNYCLVQHPPGTVPLANNQVIQQPSPIGSVPLTNNQVLKQTPPIVSVPLANNQVLKETPPIGSVPLTNNQVLKQTPPIVSVPLTNNQVLKQTPPIVSVPLTNNQVLKQSPPTVFVPRVKSEVIQQSLPLGSVPLANNQVGMQPPPIGSIPLANNQILIRPPLIGSPMMANNQVLIQPPAMFPQIGGALILATQGVGAVLPAPISSSSSKMQKTTTYVPILSKKPPSPQITQIGTTQVPANSTIGTMPAPQDDSVSAPSTTKSVNPTPNPLPPKLSNLEESKEKAVIAFKNAVLSQAAPLPSPMPSAFILALPKSLETSTPNIQIITNSTSTFQSKTTTPLVVPSTAGNLAEQGLMPLTVTDISKHSPQGHSMAARRQTVAPTHFTKQQKNTSSRGNSSLLKIGKMTYQLVSKNNKCFLVPSLQPGSDEKRNGSSKRKSTSEHPEKGFPKKKLKPSDIKARLEAMIEFSESESEPEEIEAEEDKKLARLEQEVNSPAPATDHDYAVRNADIPGVNCRRCPFSAAYWKTMAGHMRVHHLKRYCIKCNHFLKNSFPPHACTRSALKKTRKHVCLVCSKLIDNAGDLYKHYQVHHKTEIEQEGHCHSLYNSVRPQNVFICKGCLRVEFSEHNMLCHVKKAHMSDGEEDPSGHLLLKNEPICVCPVCWLHFPEKKFLDFHIEVFHVRKPGTELVCHLCSEVFTSKLDLVDHYSTHQSDIKYLCGICRQQTDPMSSLEELRSHRNAFHPTNSLTATLLCPIENCEKTYQEDTEFLQHITQHELENKCTQKCSKCSFTATSTTLMTKHEERFHYEPNKRCSICTKRLKSPAALTAHMDRHAREGDPEMFMCEKCGNLSSTRSQHRKHMQKHQYKNQKPRSCQECGENYSLARDLAMHILKCHPEVKDVRVPTQFPCIYCDYITFSSLDFRRHMTSHNRVKPYRCDFCERGFRDGDIFNQHVKQHKEGRNNRMFRCFVCHLDRERGEMRKHLKAESHKLNCQLGGLNFEDYNKDLLQLFPSRVSALLDRKNYAEKSLKEECRRVHEEHCKRAEGQMEGEERSYTVYTPEGEELLIEVPTKHPQCPECGLLFKTEEQLSEHKEYVRHLDTVATRNEFRCQVCDIYLFGRLSVAEHARCQHHRDMCRHQGLRPEDILDVNKIPQDFYDNSKKEVKSYGYKCVVCDVFFATKSSKKSHISKPGHVEKCQELGLDPADGDRFEDYSHAAKMLKKKKQDRPKLLTKPKVEGEKTINRLVKKLFTINLLGMEVPRNVAFSCLVCDITVSNRVQAIDHLHMPRHIANCEDKGTLSGPGNLCLQLKMEDYTSAVGKTVSQILGLPSDAIFPLTEEEKSLHIKQIKEAEASSGGIIKKIKGQQDSSLECLVNCVQPAVSSENHGQPSVSSPNVAVPVSLYRSILNSSVPIKQKAGLQRIGLQKIQRLPVLKKNNVPHKDKAPKQTQNASLRGTLAPRQAQTEGPMSDREDKATSVDSLAEEVIEMSNASSNVFPALNAEDVSVDSL